MNIGRNQSDNQSEKRIAAFLQETEVPDVVQEKVNKTLREIRRGGSKACKNRRWAFYLPKTAVAALFCFVVFGATVAAFGIGSLYRQRMENIDKRSIDDYYSLANVAETIDFSRDLTDAERERYLQLIEEYEKNGLFPKKEVTFIKEGKDYTGKGVALDESTLTLYLPQRTLKDEEMLEMIDFQHKVAYSIYAWNQERIIQEGGYRARMAQMTDEQVDQIYLDYCANTGDTGGGYSRQLTESESQRYEVLYREYREEGRYVEEEIPRIQTPEDYTGSGVAFCIGDCKFHLPETELTDEEFLQVIDFDCKIDYSFDRIWTQIQMGLRAGYPKP